MGKKEIEAMKETLQIQGYDGNWNYDEYMFGMYNGMELMMSIAEDREPIFKEKPKEWLKDKEVDSKPISMSHFEANKL